MTSAQAEPTTLPADTEEVEGSDEEATETDAATPDLQELVREASEAAFNLTKLRGEATADETSVASALASAQVAIAAVQEARAANPEAEVDPAFDALVAAITEGTAAPTTDHKPPLARRKAKKPRHRAVPIPAEYRRTPGRIEVRRFAADGLEVRSGAEGDVIEIVGTPIVYNTPYSVRDMLGEFEETMATGVCADVLGNRNLDCRFLFNHDGMPLSRTTAGTLTLTDSTTGLCSTARLDLRQQLANDLVIAIERGDVSQMSCGFIVGDDEWSADWSKRTIKRLDQLLDVSAVTYPASPTTSIDIAQRMFMATPVESRARLRKLWTFSRDELRAGKVLSAENAERITNAAKALAEVLDAAGVATAVAAVDDDTQGGTTDDGTAMAPGTSPESAADGTGNRASSADPTFRTVPATAQERREQRDLSFGDQEQLVQQALILKLGDEAADEDGYIDVWVRDLAEDWVVFQSWCESGIGPGMFRLSYSLDNEVVTFTGDPERVTEVTQYVPVATTDDDTTDMASSTTTTARSLELEIEVLELRRRRPRIAL